MTAPLWLVKEGRLYGLLPSYTYVGDIGDGKQHMQIIVWSFTLQSLKLTYIDRARLVVSTVMFGPLFAHFPLTA